jgi:hypothetical protein
VEIGFPHPAENCALLELLSSERFAGGLLAGNFSVDIIPASP